MGTASSEVPIKTNSHFHEHINTFERYQKIRRAKSVKKPPNKSHQDFTDLKIRLLPRSSRNQIVGKEGDILKIKVTSPPVGGSANRALIDLLARSLKLPKERVEIVSGKASKTKSVRIYGLSIEAIRLLWKTKAS